MALKGPQRGIRNYARRRQGLDFPEFGGIRKEGDAGSLPPYLFRHLENVRLLASGEIGVRGGQSKLSTSAMTGCVRGIFPPEYRAGMLGTGFYGPYGSGNDSTADAVLYFKTTRELAARDTRVGAYTGGFKIISNTIYIGTRVTTGPGNVEVRTYAPWKDSAPSMVVQIVLGAGPQDKAFADFISFGGTTYVAYEAGSPGSSVARVYTLSGSTLTADDTFTIGASAGVTAPYLVALSGTLYAAYGRYWNSATGGGMVLPIRKRTGAATWASETMPAISDWAAQSVAVYGSAFYLGGLGHTGGSRKPMILKHDGATVTVARDPVGNASGNGPAVKGMASFNGFLYFTYENATPAVMLGKFDGATWSESEFNFTTVSAGFQIDAPALIAPSDGNLYCVIKDATTGLWHLLKSAGTNTQSWSTVVPTASGNPTWGPGLVELA